ncbi:MAG: hypothetical protein IKN14_02060 [Clostridiales bacterium]|nr:hypothetical protein [Clostridiales bacterium]
MKRDERTIKASDIAEGFELFPELESADGIVSEGKTVIIKHDYYSSDSDHGRDLLHSFIRALSQTKISALILIDSGVRLLSSDDEDTVFFLRRSCEYRIVTACSSSISEYGIDLTDDYKDIFLLDNDEIAETILSSRDAVIIE